MNVATTKLELAKQLLDTEDIGIINQIKAIFSVQNEDWRESLPNSIKNSINRALKQSERGITAPHKQVRKMYSKWLKK